MKINKAENRVSEWRIQNWQDFSVPAMECLWVVLRSTGPWELGGGDINIPWYVGEAFPSLHYKVHPKTTSSIHITPFAHLFVFIHMYSFFHSFSLCT